MATAEDDHGVKLGKEMSFGEFARGVVVQHRKRQANRKGCEESGVHATFTKDALWCEGSEEDGCCEVRFDSGAGEAIFLAGFANVGDHADLEVHDSRADESGDDSCVLSVAVCAINLGNLLAIVWHQKVCRWGIFR